MRLPLVLIVPGVLLAAGYQLEAWRLAGSMGFPLDDSWIHAQFARNLATGHGFTYTGTDWVAGSTAPAWTLLLAAGYFIARDMIVAAVVLGVLLQLAAGYFAVRLAEQLDVPPPVSWMAGALVVMVPIVVWGAVSGMEVPLAAAMSLAGLDLHFRSRESPSPRRYAGIALLGLSTLARPENIVFVAIVLASELAGRGSARARLARAASHSLVAAAAIAPLVIFSYATIERPLPTTFYAKSGPGLVRALETGDAAMAQRNLATHGPQAVRNFWLILVDQFGWAAWLAVAGLIACVRAARRRLALVLLAVLVLVPFAMGLTAPQRLKPDNVRYAAQLVVLASPLMAAGVWLVLRRSRVSLLILAVACAATGWQTIKGAALYAQSVKNIQELHVTTGRWIAGHLPEDAVVAVNDVGAIAYFGGRRILDLEGLVSPEILPYRRLPDRGLRAVMDLRPDYIAIFPGWYPDIADSGLFHEIQRIGIDDNVISAGATIVVYRTPWAAAPHSGVTAR